MLLLSPVDPLPVELVAGGEGRPELVVESALGLSGGGGSSGMLSEEGREPKKIADKGRFDETADGLERSVIGRPSSPLNSVTYRCRSFWMGRSEVLLIFVRQMRDINIGDLRAKSCHPFIHPSSTQEKKGKGGGGVPYSICCNLCREHMGGHVYIGI